MTQEAKAGSTPVPPEWLVLTDRFKDPAISAAHSLINERRRSPDEGHRGRLALGHFACCLQTASQANREGFHSVAISLHRQCVEALSIIETAVLRNDRIATELLSLWLKNGKTGELRMALEKRVWANYGNGLDGESWGDFFGQLAKAVQDYSHCSPALLGWQVHMGPAEEQRDGSFRALAREGGYDSEKASLITLLHAILVWALSRIVIVNGGAIEGCSEEDVRRLGDGIVGSPLFARGHRWEVQFWPHTLEVSG
jgi:hypothetical protein